ncbi:MAG: TGS domain-containing protein [Candidatus Aureabacteria bacterium]|nr:TGS domain-containing protein [Candidatus Auribacterota bacterium]
MPANLPPQYVKAEERLRAAKDPGERIAILEEMWSLLPKHKGTDKIQADIKRRISKLKEQAEKGGGRKKGFSISIVREGAGQIAVLGPPNAGKSSFVSILAHPVSGVAPYPFSTTVPHPAMMPWRDVRVQLVDLPPFAPGHVEHWAVDIVRGADAAVLVVDAAGVTAREDTEWILAEMDRRRITLGAAAGRGGDFKRTILVANKADLPEAGAAIPAIAGQFGRRFEVVSFSSAAANPAGVESMRTRVFDLLGVVRIYSKEPGRKPDLDQPFTVRAGSTVLDFAAHVHKDFTRSLKQARIWGSARFEGQAVSRGHILRDGDIVELSL